MKKSAPPKFYTIKQVAEALEVNEAYRSALAQIREAQSPSASAGLSASQMKTCAASSPFTGITNMTLPVRSCPSESVALLLSGGHTSAVRPTLLNECFPECPPLSAQMLPNPRLSNAPANKPEPSP